MSNIVSFSKSALVDGEPESTNGETTDNGWANMWSENEKTLRQLEFRYFGGMGYLIMSALVDAVVALGVDYVWNLQPEDSHAIYFYDAQEPQLWFNPMTDGRDVDLNQHEYAGSHIHGCRWLLSSFEVDADNKVKTIHNIEVIGRTMQLSKTCLELLLEDRVIEEALQSNAENNIVSTNGIGFFIPMSQVESEHLHKCIKHTALEPMLIKFNEALQAIIKENVGSRIAKFYYHNTQESQEMTHHFTGVFSDGTAYMFSVVGLNGNDSLIEHTLRFHNGTFLGPIHSPAKRKESVQPPVNKEAKYLAEFWLGSRELVACRPLPPGGLYLGIKRFIEDVGGNRDVLVGREADEPLNVIHLMKWLSLRNLTIPTAFVYRLYRRVCEGITGDELFEHALRAASFLCWDENDHSRYANQ